MDFFLTAGLALGQTQHSDPVADGEVGRKGISCERTFQPISKTAELEAKVTFPETTEAWRGKGGGGGCGSGLRG